VRIARPPRSSRSRAQELRESGARFVGGIGIHVKFQQQASPKRLAPQPGVAVRFEHCIHDLAAFPHALLESLTVFARPRIVGIGGVFEGFFEINHFPVIERRIKSDGRDPQSERSRFPCPWAPRGAICLRIGSERWVFAHHAMVYPLVERDRLVVGMLIGQYASDQRMQFGRRRRIVSRRAESFGG